MKIIGKISIFCIIMVLILSSLELERIVNAFGNALIRTKVTYSDNKEIANIEFDFESVDKEKYDIVSIVSEKDKKVLYDKDDNAINNIAYPVNYEVKVNDDYRFMIRYIEKQVASKVEENQEPKGDIQEEKIENIPATSVNTSVNDDVEELNPENKTDVLMKENNDEITPHEKEMDELENKQVVKENIIEVNVDGIVSPKESYDKNKDRRIDKRSAKDKETFTTGNSDKTINLLEEFNVISYVSSKLGDWVPYMEVSPAMKKLIRGNKVILTSRDEYPTWNYQQTVLTWKKTIDFTRSFVLNGFLSVGEIIHENNIMRNADGLAIAFHHDGIGYRFGGNYSSNLGIYNYEGTGIRTKAIVAEIDTFDNGSSKAVLGDPKGLFAKGGHLAIMGMENGGAATPLAMNYKSEPNGNWMNGFRPFELKWNMHASGSGTLTLTFSGNSVEYEFNPTTYFSGKDITNVNMTFGGGSGVQGGSIDNSYLTYDEFRYTNAQSKMETTITPKENSNTYAIPNETLIVRHEMSNSISSKETFQEVLNLDNLSVRGGVTLTPTNIKVGTDINNLQSYVENFDKNNPIKFTLPANSQSYYVEYEVKIPDIKNYGNIDVLDYKYLLGIKGMSQIKNNGELDIKNNPQVVSKVDSVTKSIYDVYHTQNENTEQLIEMIWKELYVKTATGTEKRVEKDIANPTGSDINIKWKYFVDLQKVTKIQNRIFKGTVYSISLQVTDRSDTRLSNSFKRYVLVADNVSSGQLDSSKHMINYIFTNNLLDITETKLVTLKSNDFANYVLSNSNAKGFQVNNDSGAATFIDKLNVDTNGWVNSRGYAEKKPGEYEVNISLNENSNVAVSAKQKVTDNTWSYDSVDRTEINGASGFIVIPNIVELKNNKDSSSNDVISATTEVFFASYTGVVNTKFRLSVDKTFEIKNQDNSSVIEIISSSDGVDKDRSNNKLEVGEIDRRYSQGKGYNIIFSVPRYQEMSVKGRWTGNVTFYFERINSSN